MTDDRRPTTGDRRPTTDHRRPTTNDQRGTLDADVGRSSFVVGRPQEGRLDLLLERAGEVTRPRRCLARPPIQLSRVRYDDPQQPGMAAFTLLHLGGVLAGDRAHLRVELGPGAAARVRMAAATQVYRMPAGDAAHTIELSVGAGARLDWLAEPLILFGGARFAQTTRITLDRGARLALLDVLVPGRLARGERDAFERFESCLEVYNSAGGCLAAERALLEPRLWRLDQPGLRGDTPVVGSLYLLGDALDAERAAAEIHPAGESVTGVTALPNDCGLLVRALGDTPSAVRARLLDIWRMSRCT